MKKCKLYTRLLLSLLMIISINIYCQDFKVSSLISIPGDNKNFSTVSPSVQYGEQNSFVCWENKLDSLYTIYIKKIDPLSQNIYIAWSDTNKITNPQISYDKTSDSIKIVWQALVNDHWSLYLRVFKEGKFGNVILITDTSKNNSNPTLSDGGLAWIQEGKLLYSRVVSNGKILDSVMTIDSSNCSNPKIYSYDNQYDPTILYEKGNSPNTQIFMARYVGQIREQKPYWELSQISESVQNINPSFGTEFDISYQTKEDNVWRIIYPDYYSSQPVKTKNILCNYEHPMIFKFPIPTGSSDISLLGFFLAFDSDSLYNNKEIFMSFRSLFSNNDTLINISNSSGNDSKPTIVYLNSITTTDSSKVAIIWEHRENDKTDIWWATSPFHLLPLDVKSNNRMINNFSLSQNYPNPFNPSTTIEYQIPPSPFYEKGDGGGFVSLKVYDLLGREVATLVDEKKPAGKYTVQWNAGRLSTGVYFYSLKTGNIAKSKSMLLLK
jgi:hypothetical protein